MNHTHELSIDYARDIETDGFAIVPDVITQGSIEYYREVISSLPDGDEVKKRGSRYGVRNLLEICPPICELANSTALRALVEPVLRADSFAVRALFFDKVPEANWKLRWHQDSTITVKERRDVEGFTAWSQKAGVWHVQPPVHVLSEMLAVRVHLDDCGEDNGPLRVLPGSHRHGWLDDTIGEWRARVKEVSCVTGSGGVVMMRPLLLHASSSARRPAHRRVIHIEYAKGDLPGGLEWNQRLRPERPKANVC